jgi:hypothetical protein
MEQTGVGLRWETHDVCCILVYSQCILYVSSLSEIFYVIGGQGTLRYAYTMEGLVCGPYFGEFTRLDKWKPY